MEGGLRIDHDCKQQPGRTLFNYGSAKEGDEEEVAGGGESGGEKGEGPKSQGSGVSYFLIRSTEYEEEAGGTNHSVALNTANSASLL